MSEGGAPGGTGAPAGGASPSPSPSPAPAPAPAPAPSPAPAPAPSPAPSRAERGQNPPDPNRQVTARPDYIEEKHWDSQAGAPRVEDLAKAYKEATGKLSTRSDDLLKAARDERAKAAPKTAGEYKFELPADFKVPKGVTLDFSMQDPAVAAIAELAHSHGMNQAEFSGVLKGMAERVLKALPDGKVERDKLGENAKDRINAVKLWGEKHLGADAFKVLLGPNPTAAHVEAFEKMMQHQDPRLARPGAAAPQQGKPKTLDELRTMQRDPRYADPYKRDAAYVAQVDAEYRRSFSGPAANARRPA